MSTSDISKALKLGKFRIRSVSSAKSEAWKNFGIVVGENDEDLDFVACKQCGTVLQYKGEYLNGN
jgi:hypothetical protein